MIKIGNSADCIIKPMFEGENTPSLPPGFKGKEAQSYISFNEKWNIYIGLGKLYTFTLDKLRQLSGKISELMEKNGLKEAFIDIDFFKKTGLKQDLIVQSLVEGFELSLYNYTKSKNLTLIINAQNFEKALIMGKTVSNVQNFVRRLVDTPPNELYPENFVSEVSKETKDLNLDTKVLTENELLEKGMCGIYNVGKGSIHPQRLLVLTYTPESYKEHFVFIGKGVCFDSGGINLKRNGGRGMKGDMAGAAVAAGMAIISAKLNLDIKVTSITPLVENMPAPHALKPDDVITMYNGKRVEIISSDAEGRLILADALAFAEEMNPDHIIDIATLTGGVISILGELYSAVLGKDKKIIKKLVKSKDTTGEFFWELPLIEEYKEFLKVNNNVADIKNSAGKVSTISAALFLSEFVKTSHWTHIDIAGKEIWSKKRTYINAGATGIPLRSLTYLITGLI